MERDEWSAIAHRDLDHCNPVPAAKLETLFPLLKLDHASWVVDLGCGKGALLVRLVEEFGVQAVGVDRSAKMLEAAKTLANASEVGERIELHQAAALEFPADRGAFDLAACIGAVHALGGYEAALEHLKHCVRPGGLLLVGEGYWRRPPAPDYLAAIGGSAEDLRTHAANVQRAIDHGLVPLAAVVAGEDDWDRYEWSYSRAIEQFALEQPQTPGVETELARVRRWRAAWLLWGRDTMGFGIYLLRRP